MKNTPSKHKRLKTTLALGATALGAATSHASVVYWDTSGLNLNATSDYQAESLDFLSVSYDSATHNLASGGNFAKGQSRGVLLSAEGFKGHSSKSGYIAGYNVLQIRGAGSTTAHEVVGRVVGKGAVSLGTSIKSLDFSDGWRVSLAHGLTNSYVGIQLWANDTGTDFNYGWACISTSIDGTSVTLNGIAFESEINTEIKAGDTITAVPEPGNVLSLAALVGSAAFMRTRRKAAATAA